MSKFLLLTFLIISILIIPFSISTPIVARHQNDIDCYNKAKESHRSTTINLINQSGAKVFYTTSKLDDGIWACDPSATKVVPNGQNVTFANQSNGFLGGAAGFVSYSIGRKTPPSTFSIYWKNPFFGKNSHEVRSSNPKYAFTARLIEGSDAYYEFTIYRIL
jgi:hypothetical protein